MNRRQLIKSIFKASGAMIAIPMLFDMNLLASNQIVATDLSNLYWKIEKSGVLSRIKKGKISVQLRYCIYRNEKHPDYQKGLVDEMIEFNGKIKKTGNKINPPAHNHIISLPANLITDENIEKIGNQILVEYLKSGSNMFLENPYTHLFEEITEDVLIENTNKVNKIIRQWQ